VTVTHAQSTGKGPPRPIHTDEQDAKNVAVLRHALREALLEFTHSETLENTLRVLEKQQYKAQHKYMVIVFVNRRH